MSFTEQSRTGEPLSLGPDHRATCVEFLSTGNIAGFRALIETEFDEDDHIQQRGARLAGQAAEALLLQSRAQTARIDEFIDTFLASTAPPWPRGIKERSEGWDQDLYMGETWQRSREGLSGRGPITYDAALTSMRPAKGRQIYFVERLCHQISLEVDLDLATSYQDYIVEAKTNMEQARSNLGPTVVLARLFHRHPSLQAQLWRHVQDIIIKTAMTDQRCLLAAGDFLSLAVLLDGAGSAIDGWTSNHLKGLGRLHVNYMNELCNPFDTWTWREALEAFIDHMESADRDADSAFTWYRTNLPSTAVRIKGVALEQTRTFLRDGALPALAAEELAAKYSFVVA